MDIKISAGDSHIQCQCGCRLFISGVESVVVSSTLYLPETAKCFKCGKLYEPTWGMRDREAPIPVQLRTLLKQRGRAFRGIYAIVTCKPNNMAFIRILSERPAALPTIAEDI